VTDDCRRSREHGFIAASMGLGLWFLAGSARPAGAVVPGLFQPLQQLAALVPAFIGMAIAAILLWFGSVRRIVGNAIRFVVGSPKALGATLLIVGVGVPVGYLLLTGNANTAVAEAAQAHANPTWACFRGNLARTGHADKVPPPSRPEALWKFREGRLLDYEWFLSSPAVANGHVYAASTGGVIYAFDAATGDVKWRYETESGCPVFSSPAVADGRVYVGEGLHADYDCMLYCIDEATGDLVWEFQSGSHVESSPCVADGRVYFGGGFDGVYCVDAATGEEVWHVENLHVDGAPAVADGICFFGSGGAEFGEEAEHLFVAVDAETGDDVWSRQFEYAVWGAPAVLDGRVYVGIGNGTIDYSAMEPYGEVQCLSAEDGETIWSFTDVEDSVMTAIALDDGRAFFGSRDGKLYCVDAETGDMIFAYATSEPDDPMAVVSSPAVAGGHVVFGCEDGLVRAVDAKTGELAWKFDAASLDLAPTDARIVSSPAVAYGCAYVGSDNYYFFCLGDKE